MSCYISDVSDLPSDPVSTRILVFRINLGHSNIECFERLLNGSHVIPSHQKKYLAGPPDVTLDKILFMHDKAVTNSSLLLKRDFSTILNSNTVVTSYVHVFIAKHWPETTRQAPQSHRLTEETNIVNRSNNIIFFNASLNGGASANTYYDGLNNRGIAISKQLQPNGPTWLSST